MEEDIIKKDYIDSSPDHNKYYPQKRKNFMVSLTYMLVLLGIDVILFIMMQAGLHVSPFEIVIILIAAPLALIIYPMAANKMEQKIYSGEISKEWIIWQSVWYFLIQAAIIYIPTIFLYMIFMSIKPQMGEGGLIFAFPLFGGWVLPFLTTALFVFFPSIIKYRKYCQKENKIFLTKKTIHIGIYSILILLFFYITLKATCNFGTSKKCLGEAAVAMKYSQICSINRDVMEMCSCIQDIPFENEKKCLELKDNGCASLDQFYYCIQNLVLATKNYSYCDYIDEKYLGSHRESKSSCQSLAVPKVEP